MDLRSGYYQIGLSESAKPKITFVLSSLQQSSIWLSNFTMGYLDNMIIYSRSEKEHLEYLEQIFSRLRAEALKLKLEKYCFSKKHIQYLGHLISAEGIQPLP